MCLIDPDRIHPELDIMSCDTVALPHHIVPYLVPSGAPFPHTGAGNGVACRPAWTTSCTTLSVTSLSSTSSRQLDKLKARNPWNQHEPTQDLASAMEYQPVKHM